MAQLLLLAEVVFALSFLLQQLFGALWRIKTFSTTLQSTKSWFLSPTTSVIASVKIDWEQWTRHRIHKLLCKTKSHSKIKAGAIVLSDSVVFEACRDWAGRVSHTVQQQGLRGSDSKAAPLQCWEVTTGPGEWKKIILYKGQLYPTENPELLAARELPRLEVSQWTQQLSRSAAGPKSQGQLLCQAENPNMLWLSPSCSAMPEHLGSSDIFLSI